MAYDTAGDIPTQLLQRIFAAIPAFTREEAVSVLAMTASLHAALMVRLLTLGPALTENPEQLLSVKDAAKRLGISPRQLYRIADSLPCTVRDLGGVRFHVGRLNRYIATQLGGASV